MTRLFCHALYIVVVGATAWMDRSAVAEEPLFPQTLNVTPPAISSDPSVRYDYDIVYVRAKRAGD